MFLLLHPTHYAEMQGAKMDEHPEVPVWLINTGWSRGSHSAGLRMKLGYTHTIVTVALAEVPFHRHPVFGVVMPTTVPGVPATC